MPDGIEIVDIADLPDPESPDRDMLATITDPDTSITYKLPYSEVRALLGVDDIENGIGIALTNTVPDPNVNIYRPKSGTAGAGTYLNFFSAPSTPIVFETVADSLTSKSWQMVKPAGSIFWVKEERTDVSDLSMYAVKEEFLTSKNFFNKSGTINTGFFLNSGTGLPNASATSAYSDYIAVDELTTYTISGTVSLSNPTAMVVVFYDASHTLLSVVSNMPSYTHTTPAGAKFVRFNVRYANATANYDTLQYEKGSKATQYRPFGNLSVQNSVIDMSDIVAKDDLFTRKNLFDKTVPVNTGFYLSSSTGNPTTSATSAYSNYIPVQELTTYTLSGVDSLSDASANVVVFYDATLTQISRVSNVGNYTHTTPAGAKYVRFNIRFNSATANYDNVQYEKGAIASAYATFGVASVNNSLIDLSAAGVVSKAELFGYKNLFNKNASINTGFYLNSGSGNPSGSANSAYCGYIPVDELTTYTLSGLTSLSLAAANVVVFYDASLIKLSQVSGVANMTHTTPAGAKYVRFNIRYNSASANYDLVQYEKGNKPTQYRAYGDRSILPTLVDTTTTSSAVTNIGVPAADIYLIPCYGQSLSIGTDGGATTFSVAVAIAYNVSLVNDNVQDMNGGYVEMFKMLADEFQPLASNFKIMTCLGGSGGKSVLQLSKGSSYYTALMNNIQTAIATAYANGLTINVPAFVWTQGEEDMRCGGVAANYGSGAWDPFEYGNKLKQLIDDINTDVKAMLPIQQNDVKCIMYQTGSHNAYYRYPRIAMEQLKLAINDKRVSLAKVMYDADYNTADYVHCPNKTYRNMGNNYGIHLYEAIAQNKHPLPIHPVSKWVVGNDIYIRFHVPAPPLVLDTTIVAALPDGNYGFNLYTVTNEISGASGTIAPATETITAVTLFNANTVKITVSAIPPAGTRLTYAVNGDGSQYIGGTGTGGKSGRTNGARGNLRDSRTYLNIISNSLFQLFNWCPIFEIIL